MYSQNVKLKNTQQFPLKSKTVKGETYSIYVYLPENYDETAKYPVVYLLDADKTFSIVKGLLDFLILDKAIKEIMVIGIGYKDDEDWWNKRSRDLLPTKDMKTSLGKKWPMAGGAEDFYLFLTEELIPEIEEWYPIDKNNRGVIGFSFGGFFASYVLLKYPDLFNNHIIISPGLSWDNNYILEVEDKYNKNRSDLNKNVFISLSSEESKELIIEPTKLFIERLESRKYPSLKLITEMNEGETHFAGFSTSLSNGLKTFYNKKGINTNQ
ncbi:alpha/beta hydrolase [Bacteroidota bacterium]